MAQKSDGISQAIEGVAAGNLAGGANRQPGHSGLKKYHLLLFLAILGPGLVAMLADADVGSIVTAAQSGAQWGYKLLALQVLMIPVLYVVQELTVRLGIFTGKGHGELIRETFGRGWAWLSVAGLAVACLGALITEFAGISGVGLLFGVPQVTSLALAVTVLLVVVWTGSYRRVERIAIILGLFELAFLWVAMRAPVQGHELMRGLVSLPVHNHRYWYMVSANIGAVIMPWMVFYQQSAVTDKKLKPDHYTYARWDTAIGAVLTQVVMVAVLVAAAATLGKTDAKTPLDTVGQIAQALTPALGARLGHIVFGLGILGGAMVSAIVVSLAMSWGFCEVTGDSHSLGNHPLEAPWFYGIFSAGVIGSAFVVLLVPNLVTLAVAVQVMNAFLLPLVLGFLVALAVKALPPEHRLRGAYFWVVLGVVVVTCVLGIYGGLRSLWR